MSRLSRCQKFCPKNIRILLIHSNSRWTKGSVVATDFQVFSVIFEIPRISCSIFWALSKYFPKSNEKVKEKKLNKNETAGFSINSFINTISFKEKKVLLLQYVISSLNPFKMCPVLDTGTNKDQNLIIGPWHFSKKRKLYYTNGGNHCFVICFRYFCCCYLVVYLVRF